MKSYFNQDFDEDLEELLNNATLLIAKRFDQNKKDEQSFEGPYGELLSTAYANTQMALNEISAIMSTISDEGMNGLPQYKNLILMISTLAQSLRMYIDGQLENMANGNNIQEFVKSRTINEVQELLKRMTDFRNFYSNSNTHRS